MSKEAAYAASETKSSSFNLATTPSIRGLPAHENWSLTSLQERLVKTAGQVVQQVRFFEVL